jgi:hypothetical protein
MRSFRKLFSNQFYARRSARIPAFLGHRLADGPISATGGRPRKTRPPPAIIYQSYADRVSRMQRQPRLALQLPEQAPCPPLPLQLPPPLLPLSLPPPQARPAPDDTHTLTAPLFETRPDTLPPPPPETIPLEMNTPYR